MDRGNKPSKRVSVAGNTPLHRVALCEARVGRRCHSMGDQGGEHLSKGCALPRSAVPRSELPLLGTQSYSRIPIVPEVCHVGNCSRQRRVAAQTSARWWSRRIRSDLARFAQHIREHADAYHSLTVRYEDVADNMAFPQRVAATTGLEVNPSAWSLNVGSAPKWDSALARTELAILWKVVGTEASEWGYRADGGVDACPWA